MREKLTLSFLYFCCCGTGDNASEGLHSDDASAAGRWVESGAAEPGRYDQAGIRDELHGDAEHPAARELPHPADLLCRPATVGRDAASGVQTLSSNPEGSVTFTVFLLFSSLPSFSFFSSCVISPVFFCFKREGPKERVCSELAR